MAEPNLVPRAAKSASVGTVLKPYLEMRAGQVVSERIIIRKTASAALSGHRVVVVNSDDELEYASSATVSHASKILGIITSAVEEDAQTDVVKAGEITESSWTWTPQASLFLGTNGSITHTVPSSGFVCKLGFAITATKMMVAIQPSIVLVS